MFVVLFGFPPFYVDPNKFYNDQKEEQAIYALIKKGFDPAVKRGYGPWFPKKMPISEAARSLMSNLMEMDLSKRWSASDALQSEWIQQMGKCDVKPKASSSGSNLNVAIGFQFANFANNNKFKYAISGLFRDQFAKMRPQQFNNLKKLFTSLDKDGNGKIDYEEFQQGMLKSKDLNLNEEQIQRIFNGLVNVLGEIGIFSFIKYKPIASSLAAITFAIASIANSD
jgi:serine/threonine protein kinase